MTHEIKRNYIARPYKLDLQLFADSGGEEGEGAGNGGEGGEKTFTQAELDRILADRLDRDRKKYADYDDLKAKITEFERAEAERQKQAMTEQERLAAEKAEAERKAQEAEDRAAQTLAAANERLIKAAFMLKARAANVREDALDDAFKLADFSGVTVGDDGSAIGVDEVVTALIASKAFLLEVKSPQPKIIGDERGVDVNDEVKTLEQQLDEARKKRDFAKVVELSNKIKAIKK